MPLNYNKWDKLELSDDSDIEVHPNVDKKSMIRWKQRDIHEKREMRKLKLHHLDQETIMNDQLLAKMHSLHTSIADEGVPFVQREVARLRTLVPDFATKQFKEGEQPSQDHMVLSLLSQVWDAVEKDGKGDNGKGERLAKELTSHIERLEQRQQDIVKEKAELEAEQKKYITMDDLHTGFESKTIISSKPSAQPVASTSKPKTESTKKKETTIETLNSPGVQAAQAAAAARESDDDDAEEEVPELTPIAVKFSNLPSLDFREAYEFISDNPSLLAEETTDALLVEAFSVAMKGKDRRARECVEKGLMLQYCRHLGQDGVALFFKRMTSSDPKALKVFLDDVAQTSERIINRARTVAKEKEAEPATEAREQIQLVASDPSTVITFEVPDGPPPENLEITGEGSEELDPELVRQFLQRRWDIFQGFSKGLRTALSEKSLVKVNKVLGKMDVPEAEEVVRLLQESGILSFAQNDIVDATKEDDPLNGRVPVQVDSASGTTVHDEVELD
ncbi:hsp90 co-chaperone Cdc37 [Microbotryomycetes sp. JL201]|nr:hsp90 co-chaperone Cdc37 [Microbotryomycetes sp. JL201]